MKIHNTFLEKYKRLELNLRTVKNAQVKDYEDDLNSQGKCDESEKLHYCRNIRNYMSHHPNSLSFVGITEEILLFIDQLNEDLNEMDAPIRKKMISLSKALTETSTLMDASCYLSKKKISIAPVFSKTGECIGVITPEIILLLIADGKSPKTTRLSAIKEYKQSQKKCSTLMENDTYSSIIGSPRNLVFLIKSEKDGKVVGFVVG